MVGNMFIDCRGVAIDAASLASRKVADGRGKTGVGDKMRRTHQRRHEASGHLVLALGAGLEALQLLLDAVLDSLVVARLEMQTVIVAAGTPVAAEQGIVAHEEYGHRDAL